MENLIKAIIKQNLFPLRLWTSSLDMLGKVFSKSQPTLMTNTLFFMR